MTLIIGHRGVPNDAPENTLSSLRLAMDLGLDGFEYDLQSTKDGDPVLLHDDTLERTTDSAGPVSERLLSELFGLDAGSWFGVRFSGEPLPSFEEAWVLESNCGQVALHLIELKTADLLPAVMRTIQGDKRRPFLILSFHKAVCLAARDMGLDAMYLGEVATEAARRFVRDERLAAFGAGPKGWTGPGAVCDADWDCQRWSWSVDSSEELLWAFRLPLFGLNTNEPRRALALREMVRLAPDYTGPPPLVIDELLVDGLGLAAVPVDVDADEVRSVLEPWTSAWCGEWKLAGRLSNPFDWPVRVYLEAVARGGAFEFLGADLEGDFELGVGESVAIEVGVLGGSRSPGPDPRLLAHFEYDHGSLSFDVTLTRRREARLHEGATRLSMLREAPGEPAASVVVSRRQRDLVFRIENDGGLQDACLVLRLGTETFNSARYGRHFALQLTPAMFDAARATGLDFALGFHGLRNGQRRIYRFGGGLPPGIFSGSMGRLVLV